MANEQPTTIEPKEQVSVPVAPAPAKPLNPSASDLPPNAEPAMEGAGETMEMPTGDGEEAEPPAASAEPEAGSSQLADEMAPETPAPAKEQGTDDLLEQLRADRERVDAPSADNDIDLETNQILLGTNDPKELQAMMLKLYPSLQVYAAAKKDPESLLSLAVNAYNHGWGTTSGGDLEEVLLTDEVYKNLHPQKDTERFPGMKDGHPSRITHKSVDVTGQEAILAIKARLGGIVRVNLVNSGFWVALRSPQLDELQEVFATIDFENREIGRILGGHFALITDMYLKKKFVEILISKRLIIESNFKDVFKQGAFVRNLAYHDYDTLLHAIVMLMTRGGMRYRCICPKCGNTSVENLDVSACKFVNEELWTPEVQTYWNTTKTPDGKLLKHDEKDLLKYREEIFNHKAVFTEEIDNGFGDKVRIDLEIQEPTMQKFFEIGETLINNLNTTINHIANGDQEKADLVKASLAVHSYQLFAPWINMLKLYRDNGEVEIQTSDPNAILSHLDETGKKGEGLFKEITKFIAHSRFNFFGTHSIQCPQCHARPTSKMENFYPLEIQTIFFGLSSRLWLTGR